MKVGTPLRVCMVVAYDLAEPGGVKHHAVELACALRERGDDVTLIGPSSTPVEGIVRFGGVANIVSNGSDNRLGLFVSPRQVWHFFRHNRFDVLHVHEPLLPSLPYWAIWASTHMARVATFHAFAEQRSSLLRLASQGFAALQFPWIHHAIAVSSSAAQYASATWRRALPIIPNGVRTDIFRPGIRSPGQPLRLLFVGRLSDERKGFRYLLTAYAEARRQGLDVELSVVGDNAGANAVPDLPGLVYHGVVSRGRLVDEYQHCDVVIVPSTGQESFGIVLLEAMACGKAVICSDIPGYRETVAGAPVFMVRPENVTDLVAALRAVLAKRDELEQMGRDNREHASRYDWARIVERVRSEYMRAIEIASEAKVRSALPVEARVGSAGTMSGDSS